jgi:hypothetical protein
MKIEDARPAARQLRRFFSAGTGGSVAWLLGSSFIAATRKISRKKVKLKPVRKQN